MKIYEVRADVKGKARITFTDIGQYRKIVDMCSTGEPLPAGVVFPIGYLSSGGFYQQSESTDCPYLNNNCLVLTQTALNVLEKYIKNFVDIIPIRCFNSRDQFFLINVYSKAYLALHNPIGYYTIPSEKDTADVENPFTPEIGSKIPIIFKMEETKSSRINCTKDLIEVVRIAGLKGFWFNLSMARSPITMSSAYMDKKSPTFSMF